MMIKKNIFLPILSTSEYSKIVLGRGSSYDEECNITHVHVELGFCRKCVWMKQHNFNPESFHNTWIMTWSYRRKIKIQIDTFTRKTETNQVDQFLLCQVFLCFGSSPFGLWTRSPRPDLRPEARFAPKQDVSSDILSRRRVGGWCFSSDVAHNTKRFHTLCILWRIFSRGRECLSNSPKLSTI